MMKRQATMAAALVMLAALSACKEDLLVDLSQEQANRVVATLDRHRIDATKETGEKSRYKVTVEEDDFAAAAAVLDAYGLPGAVDIEVADMFPADAVVATPVAERARLLSAVEQRLARSIAGVENVLNARVHVSYAEPKTPLRVSAMVIHDSKEEEALFIEKIKRLLKNSFAELQYDNISVVLFKRNGQALPAAPAPSSTDAVVTAAGIGLGALGLVAAAFGWRFRDRLRGLRRRQADKGTAAPPAAAPNAPAARPGQGKDMDKPHESHA
jgi:type III secretion system YscJ/HrcJ family lipoprotein